MRIREHKNSLSESLATTVEIEPTKAAIAKHWSDVCGIPVLPEDVKVDYYCYDDRVSQHLYIVTSKLLGVFGFCDREVKE